MTVIDQLPSQLREKGLFCCWRRELRDGKQTKVLYNPSTGCRGKSNDPSTFAPLSVAEAVQSRYDGLGVGIFDGISAIDIDHCINAAGVLSPMAQDIVDLMKGKEAYIEKSPSGQGIRILFTAPGFAYDKAKYYINNQSIGLEVYVSGATNKYVTVTGTVLHKADVLPDCTEVLKVILDKYMKRCQDEYSPTGKPQATDRLSDSELIAKMKSANNGAAFAALWAGDTSGYKSPSEADMALCSMLAFRTGRDAERMDKLIRQSGLMREKWDRPQSGTTYGALTIQHAIESCAHTYAPQNYFKERADGYSIHICSKKTMLADLHPEKSERYAWTDIGNGYLFADWYKGQARYVPERKKWFIFEGRRWVPDIDNLQTMELCKQLADQLMIYALSLQDEYQRHEYMNFIGRWQKRSCRETILKDAAGIYPIGIDQFDSDPFLFNCLNGTLDIRTGEFYTHRSEDLLSKLAGVRYDPHARSERWKHFVSEVMQEDVEKAAFLQKSLGYALTGDTRHECFFILYGPSSRNGKGTCMETFMRLVGDYGKSAKPDTIAQKQTANGSGPSEDIARLVGARFVNISEPDKKLVLSAALVKTLTGNDSITARYLHENSFEYRPQFKLFINTNHLPSVTDATLFSSGRVKIIPFERHFRESERDEGLKSELASLENLSGVLNWCLAGLRMIEKDGFREPDAVRDATDEYRNNNDKMGRFLAEEMEADPTAETRTADAYIRYKTWCIANGFFPENAANFKSSINNVAIVVRKRPAGCGREANPTNFIVGYRLKAHFTVVNEPTPWD